MLNILNSQVSTSKEFIFLFIYKIVKSERCFEQFEFPKFLQISGITEPISSFQIPLAIQINLTY
jgi:hypothetical protein